MGIIIGMIYNGCVEELLHDPWMRGKIGKSAENSKLPLFTGDIMSDDDAAASPGKGREAGDFEHEPASLATEGCHLLPRVQIQVRKSCLSGKRGRIQHPRVWNEREECLEVRVLRSSFCHVGSIPGMCSSASHSFSSKCATGGGEREQIPVAAI